MEYRNPEHYPDPATGKAIENIEQCIIDNSGASTDHPKW